MATDWRTWLFSKLSSAVPITDLVPSSRIFQTLEEAPDERPFMVIRLQDGSSVIPSGSDQFAQVWVHDQPGSYLRIDTLLALVRETIDGPVADAEDAIHADWRGDSPDLADDARGTIVRYGTYRLVGRR